MNNKKIYPWVVVALLWVVALLNYMDRQMLSTMRDAMAIDITELEDKINFGKIMAAFMWIYGCMSPISGIVADRINRKWLIVVSLAVWSTVTLLMGYATCYEHIYWLRAAMGVSEALYIPAALSLIADYFTGKQLSFAIGIHMTGLYMGQAVGGFGAFVAKHLSVAIHLPTGLASSASPTPSSSSPSSTRSATNKRRPSGSPSPSRCAAGSAWWVPRSVCSSPISPSGPSSYSLPPAPSPAGPPRTGSPRSLPTAWASTW